MIPEFPRFKKLELSDKPAVEALTATLPPYSDFNFVSMWSWDTSEEREIAQLNGNLVVKFTDYRTNEPFLSFMGGNAPEETIRTLLEYGEANGLPNWLQLVPEESVSNTCRTIVSVKEDEANFDYVFSVDVLSSMSGGEFYKKRPRISQFVRSNPDARLTVIDLKDSVVQAGILGMLRLWEKNKIADGKEYTLEHEEPALQRLLGSAASHNLLAFGLFTRETMLGFSIDEVVHPEYSMGHFWKADVTHNGIYDFIMREKAKHLQALGVKFMNYEQDLGIHSLRMSKAAYRPIGFLKKYIVTMAN